jgi:hypothetical protein
MRGSLLPGCRRHGTRKYVSREYVTDDVARSKPRSLRDQARGWYLLPSLPILGESCSVRLHCSMCAISLHFAAAARAAVDSQTCA